MGALPHGARLSGGALKKKIYARRQLQARVWRFAALRNTLAATEDWRQSSKGFVHRVRIREDVHELGIENDDIRPLSIPSGGDTANPL